MKFVYKEGDVTSKLNQAVVDGLPDEYAAMAWSGLKSLRKRLSS